MPRQTNSPQSRERRLRRVAQRLGFEIRRIGSGRERGRYHLDPLGEDVPPHKRKPAPPSMTLDDVEARLDALQGGTSPDDEE